MPGIGSQETHPIAALQDIGEFGVMGKFRFQAGIALFIQIIVVNGKGGKTKRVNMWSA